MYLTDYAHVFTHRAPHFIRSPSQPLRQVAVGRESARNTLRCPSILIGINRLNMILKSHPLCMTSSAISRKGRAQRPLSKAVSLFLAPAVNKKWYIYHLRIRKHAGQKYGFIGLDASEGPVTKALQSLLHESGDIVTLYLSLTSCSDQIIYTTQDCASTVSNAIVLHQGVIAA
jgi:hypothetical protein